MPDKIGTTGGVIARSITRRALLWAGALLVITLDAPSAFAQTTNPASPAKASIDRLDTIGPYLGDCIGRKAREKGLKHRGPRELTVRLSFNSEGALLGEPVRTFSMPEASQPDQKLFIEDFITVLKSCAPLPFSKELGGAMAGRPYSFRYKLQNRQNPNKQDLRA